MDDIYNKFIIETDDELGDCLIIAKCTFHKQLVTDEKKVKGGGMWKFEDNKETIVLFGESHKFGKATIDDIKNCIKNDNVYTNPTLSHSIVSLHDFKYDKYGEIINLKQ